MACRLRVHAGSCTGTSSRRTLFLTSHGFAKILDFGPVKLTRGRTNLQVDEDEAAATGYNLEIGPFLGWKDVPTW